MNFTKSIAVSLTGLLNRYTKRDGIALTKMTLGMESLVINVSKMLVIYLLAITLGIVWQTFVTHFAFVVIKRYSFGLHALSSLVCTFAACAMFVAVPWVLRGAGLGNFGVFVIFSGVILAMYFYAPADTKARPLIGQGLRSGLKKKAVLSAVLLMIVTLIVPDEAVKLLLTVGAVCQTIMVLPLTYKILKRSERNYEKHE